MRDSTSCWRTSVPASSARPSQLSRFRPSRPPRRWRAAFAAGLLAAPLGGCVSRFGDHHLFATIDPATQQVVNIFRVRVSGDAALANSRYVSGFYDERAVDLFFNEVKSQNLADDYGKAGVEKFFPVVDCVGKTDADCKSEQDKALRIVPLGSDAGKNGAFVLILSTSADAISSTIGAFAENQQVVQSAMYLANAPRLRRAAEYQAKADTVDKLRGASVTELDKLLAAADGAKGSDTKKQLYIATLQAVAAGLDPASPPAFKEIDEARAWFAAHPRGAK